MESTQTQWVPCTARKEERFVGGPRFGGGGSGEAGLYIYKAI